MTVEIPSTLALKSRFGMTSAPRRSVVTGGLMTDRTTDGMTDGMTDSTIHPRETTAMTDIDETIGTGTKAMMKTIGVDVIAMT